MKRVGGEPRGHVVKACSVRAQTKKHRGPCSDTGCIWSIWKHTGNRQMGIYIHLLSKLIGDKAFLAGAKWLVAAENAVSDETLVKLAKMGLAGT